jgi:hypothetical protein
LRLQQQISRIASNFEVVSMIADIAQQQWLFTFFRFSDRTPMSRVRDCCEIWLKSVEFRADAISGHGGPVQYGRESAHKSWALGNHSSLGDYMYEIQHINEEENVLISGTREKSAVKDSAEPKQ